MTNPTGHVVHTDGTPAVRAFPWTNGVMLAENRRVYLEEAFEGSCHPKGLLDMALSLASQVDAQTSEYLNDIVARNFLEMYFGSIDDSSVSPENTCTAMMCIDSDPHPSYFLVAARVLFRNRLLDIFADTLDVPRHPSLACIPRAPKPTGTVPRLEQLLGKLKDWPSLIQNFRKLDAATTSGPIPFSDVVSQMSSINSDQSFFSTGLRILAQAENCDLGKDYHKVKYNIEVLVFSIWWFAAGFEDFPKDDHDLHQALAQRGKDLKMPLESYQWLSRSDDALSKLARLMRNTLHLAIAISPLIVLQPRKLSQDNIRRDFLIAHAISFGNEKPKSLHDAENALWYFVFNLATGADYSGEMSKFFMTVEQIDMQTEQNVDVGWFVKVITKRQLPTIDEVTDEETRGKKVTKHDSSADETSEEEGNNIAGGTLVDQEVDLINFQNHSDSNTENNQDMHHDSDAVGDSDSETSSNSDNAQSEDSYANAAERAKARRAELRKIKEAQRRAREAENKAAIEAAKRQVERYKAGEIKHIKVSDLELVAKDKEARDAKGVKDKKRKNIRPSKPIRVPDLPNTSTLPLRPRPRIPVMADLKPVKASSEGVKVKLFTADPHRGVFEYDFKVPESIAEVEHKLLVDIQRSVESRYEDGRPLHHLPSARMIEYAPDTSEFFITTTQQLEKLKGHQVQEIFRHRHIVIPGTAPEDLEFNNHGLASLGLLTAKRQIQVNHKRTVDDPSKTTLHQGTLLDLLDSDEDKRLGLNVLDLPMGGAPVPTPPQYCHLASNEQAWQETRDLVSMMRIPFPSDDMVWGTAATQNATTWAHIDDHGLATIIKVKTGRKYWVVMRPKKNASLPGSDGDMGSINAFADAWQPWGSSSELWDHEGILLEAGDTLYMRPNTVHYVLTVDDAITYGRHFYPAHTAQSSTFAIIHVFILNYGVTNTLHDEMYTFVRRMMAMWHVRYNEDLAFDPTADPHVPNISTVSGLMDIISFGNLLELAQVIDRRDYGKDKIHWVEAPEMGIARWRYRKLQTYFAKRYVTEVGGKKICPLSIFRRSLVEFAVAIVIYKKKRAYVAPKGHGGTPAQVQEKMIRLFENNHPELLYCLKQMIAKGDAECLYWTGPSITIRRRTRHDKYPAPGDPKRVPQQLDFDDRQIFGPDEPDVEEPDVDKSAVREAEDDEDLDVEEPDDDKPVVGEAEDDEDPDFKEPNVDESAVGESEDDEDVKDRKGKRKAVNVSIASSDEEVVTRKKDRKRKRKAVNVGIASRDDSEEVLKAVQTPSAPRIRRFTRSQQGNNRVPVAGSSKPNKESATIGEGSSSAPKHGEKRRLPVDSGGRKETRKKQKHN